MSAAEVIAAAAEFLDGARKRKVTEMPPFLLARENAELRRFLGQVLDVLGEWQVPGGTTLAPEQRVTVLTALDEAAGELRDRAANCGDCPHTEGGLCATCDSRLDRAAAYDRLATSLGGVR